MPVGPIMPRLLKAMPTMLGFFIFFQNLPPKKGVAGFLLANGALGDSDAYTIRKKLLKLDEQGFGDKVEAIIVLPRELFYNTDISVTLWILNQNKKARMWHGRKLRDRTGQILFMDLRQWTQNPVKGEQKKKVMFDAEQIKRASEIYFKWQSEGTDGATYAEPELYRSVSYKELAEKENDFSLVPSRYIKFVDRDLEADYHKVLSEATTTISDLLRRQSDNNITLRNALKQLGYECK